MGRDRALSESCPEAPVSMVRASYYHLVNGNGSIWLINLAPTGQLVLLQIAARLEHAFPLSVLCLGCAALCCCITWLSIGSANRHNART